MKDSKVGIPSSKEVLKFIQNVFNHLKCKEEIDTTKARCQKCELNSTDIEYAFMIQLLKRDVISFLSF